MHAKDAFAILFEEGPEIERKKIFLLFSPEDMCEGM
jgi:hypothetical protein